MLVTDANDLSTLAGAANRAGVPVRLALSERCRQCSIELAFRWEEPGAVLAAAGVPALIWGPVLVSALLVLDYTGAVHPAIPPGWQVSIDAKDVTATALCEACLEDER